ncbi:hypothetical protein PG994_006115 [Apiospora phragmitis]|uniref:Uncharacterized protein n=1 Tax=Apiospora phragmitis TaxID=2905665 RepID=A0ABR1VHN7_9PEZI
MSELTHQGPMTNFSCTVGHWTGAAVPHDITVGEVAYWPARNPQGNATRPQDTFEWKALAACCADPKAIAKALDGCVLWCELPCDDDFPPNNDPRQEDGKYGERFADCLKSHMPDGVEGLATAVRHADRVNNTDTDAGNGNPSSSSPAPSFTLSPTAGAPGSGETGKSATVPLLRLPSVLGLGLGTVMAGVYTMLS